MDVISYTFVDTLEVEAVVRLYQAGGWWKESEEARRVIPFMIKGSFAFMVAKNEQNEIIAMGRALSDGYSDAYIQDVVVLQTYRKRGIGREIIRRLVQFCLDRKLGWIGLIAEPGTVPFYETLGFAELREYRPMLHHSK